MSTVNRSAEHTAPVTITLDELRKKIGSLLGTSSWHTVDQSQIDRFADLTNDRYFLHVDPIRARLEGPYGGTIAHGLLILALVSDMAAKSLPVCAGMTHAVNYGFNRVRFIEAVRSGSRIRANFVLADVDLRDAKQVLIGYRVEIEVEGRAGHAVVADWLSLIFLR